MRPPVRARSLRGAWQKEPVCDASGLQRRTRVSTKRESLRWYLRARANLERRLQGTKVGAVCALADLAKEDTP